MYHTDGSLKPWSKKHEKLNSECIIQFLLMLEIVWLMMTTDSGHSLPTLFCVYSMWLAVMYIQCVFVQVLFKYCMVLSKALSKFLQKCYSRYPHVALLCVYENIILLVFIAKEKKKINIWKSTLGHSFAEIQNVKKKKNYPGEERKMFSLKEINRTW